MRGQLPKLTIQQVGSRKIKDARNQANEMLALSPCRPIKRIVYIVRRRWDKDDVVFALRMQSLGGVLHVDEQNRAGDLRLVNVRFCAPHGNGVDVIL